MYPQGFEPWSNKKIVTSTQRTERSKNNNNFDIYHYFLKKITTFEQQICYILEMGVKSIAMKAARVDDAIMALGRTDNVLAVIGVILMSGVIASAYGAIWQGRLAQKQFNEQCVAQPNGTNVVQEQKKTKAILYISITIIVILVFFMIYTFSRRKLPTVATS